MCICVNVIHDLCFWLVEHTESTFRKSHLHILHLQKFVFVMWILTENTNHISLK